MYANSGQNKLNVNEKGKKTNSNLYQKVSGQSCAPAAKTTVFIKSNVLILKQFLTETGRKSFDFVSQFTEKKP